MGPSSPPSGLLLLVAILLGYCVRLLDTKINSRAQQQQSILAMTATADGDMHHLGQEVGMTTQQHHVTEMRESAFRTRTDEFYFFSNPSVHQPST